MCAKITAAALCASAVFTTSRGYTLVCAKRAAEQLLGRKQPVLAVEEDADEDFVRTVVQQ